MQCIVVIITYNGYDNGCITVPKRLPQRFRNKEKEKEKEQEKEQEKEEEAPAAKKKTCFIFQITQPYRRTQQ